MSVSEPAPAASPFTAKEYLTEHPIWCPGCGDFGVLSSLTQTLAARGINPKNLAVVSGIGCSGRTPGFVKCYGFHVVHGRVLPVSMGLKVARPELTVMAVGGDGDGFAIGGGHIPHAARRNINITYLVMDNQTYGLTKGQASPTSPLGMEAGSTPYGNVEEPLNPIAMTIAYGASFVAQGYSGKPKELTQLIDQAVDHRGFAFVNVISPCITFYNTYKALPPKLADIPPNHDVTNQAEAFRLALDCEKIRLGVFYAVKKPTFEEKIQHIINEKSAGVDKGYLERLIARFV